jgi:hypothetical protein
MTTPAAEKFASFNWMRSVADDKRISIIHRFILIRLVLHRQKDGRCDPGYDSVAKELGVDRTTVIRAVDAGVRTGWLAPPIRGRRANASFIFTFADQEVAPGATSRADQEVAQASDFLSNQEVAPDELRSRSKRVKKSLKKEAFRATSKASTEHGHLTGKENGKKRELAPSPPVASLGGKKASKSLPREESKPEAAPEPRGAELVAAADDGFARFWAAYPRQIEQEDARAAFAKAVKGGVDIEVMIARARVYAIERATAKIHGVSGDMAEKEKVGRSAAARRCHRRERRCRRHRAEAAQARRRRQQKDVGADLR